MKHFERYGDSLFLKVELEVLIERGKSVIDRPLLKNDYEKKLKRYV